MMKYLILSCSLHPRSLSRVLARRLADHLPEEETDFVDLVDHPLPLCDGHSAYSHPSVKDLSERIKAARGVVIASPVYNYDVSAATKNVLELTGRAWTRKVVGMVCAAGGKGSYMAPMGFLNSLMLDYRSFVLPSFVMTTGLVYEENLVLDGDIERRIQGLASDFVRVSDALAPVEPAH